MSTAGACVSKCTQVHEYFSSQSPKTRSLSTDRCLCSSASHMSPKRKGRAQPRLDVPKYKLLRQPMSLLGTQQRFSLNLAVARRTTPPCLRAPSQCRKASQPRRSAPAPTRRPASPVQRAPSRRARPQCTRAAHTTKSACAQTKYTAPPEPTHTPTPANALTEQTPR